MTRLARTRITFLGAAALLVPLGCDRALLVGVGDGHVPPPEGTGGTREPIGTGGNIGGGSGGITGDAGEPIGTGGNTGGSTSLVVRDVALGSYQACALLSDGSVRCWGVENSSGSLGDGTLNAHDDPRPVVGLAAASSVYASYVYGCAVAGGATSCWGSDRYGQFGDGRQGDGPAITLSPVAAFGGATLTQLALGEYHACALMPDTSVACTGLNLQGQLGDGTTNQRATPATVTGLTGVTQVAAGGNFSCALRGDQTVSCWGMNANDDVCTNVNGEYHSPRAVAGVAGATKLAAGSMHMCALLADQTVTCWGTNSYGQLGTSAPASCSTGAHGPQVIPGLTDVTDLVSGGNHTCALRADGTVACWGYNKYGQLGDGSTTDRQTPALVTGLTGVVRLAAGDGLTCAIVTGGALMCWGSFPYDAPPPAALHPAVITF